MNISVDDISEGVAREVSNELGDALERIEHCLKQLNDGQVWWRPDESMNSIANLMLHLCGNTRQWIVSGVGGATDTRDRPREFSERAEMSKDELFQHLAAVVSEAKTVLSSVTPTKLLRVRRVQGFEVTGIQAMIASVAHFRGHVQEIVHMTRCQLGDNYNFAFVPTTPEQGASE